MAFKAGTREATQRRDQRIRPYRRILFRWSSNPVFAPLLIERGDSSGQGETERSIPRDDPHKETEEKDWPCLGDDGSTISLPAHPGTPFIASPIPNPGHSPAYSPYHCGTTGKGKQRRITSQVGLHSIPSKDDLTRENSSDQEDPTTNADTSRRWRMGLSKEIPHEPSTTGL